MSASHSRAAELGERVEDHLKVKGRAADDLEHTGCGGLLLQGLLQLASKPRDLCFLRGAATAAQGLRCIAARQRLAVVRFSRFATRFITPSHRRPLAQDTASYRLAPTDAYKIAVKDCTTSALGHKRTFAAQNVMSALPLKADMCSATRHVR